MKKAIYILLSFSILLSCQRTKDKAKQAIKGSGEIVGKSASEFTLGVTEGIDETLVVSVKVSKELREKGLDLGKALKKDAGGSDNQLDVYMIFNKSFNDTIIVKIKDSRDVEMGRCSKPIVARKDSAGYIEFTFDERANIDVYSKISME